MSLSKLLKLATDFKRSSSIYRYCQNSVKFNPLLNLLACFTCYCLLNCCVDEIVNLKSGHLNRRRIQFFEQTNFGCEFTCANIHCEFCYVTPFMKLKVSRFENLFDFYTRSRVQKE